MVRNITRGGQTVSQNISMFGQVFSYITFICFLVFILTFFLCAYINIPFNEAYDTYKFYELDINRTIGKNLGYKNEFFIKKTKHNGSRVHSKYLYHKLKRSGSVKKTSKSLKHSVMFAAILSLMSVVASFIYFRRRGNKVSQDKYIRGAYQVEPQELKSIIKKKYKQSKVSIGGIPLISDSERQHITIYGSTGTGKTQIFISLLDQIRKNGDRFVAYDYCQEFIPRFYNPESDIILNFFDERCPYWDPWLECKKRADFDALAESIMPEEANSKDPFWMHAARIVFSSVCYRIGLEKEPSINRLLKTLLSIDNENIKGLIKGTEAEILVHETQDKLALSVKAMLATYLRSFKYLPEKSKDSFSIRDWVVNVDHPGSVFIATSPREESSMRPLITAILDQASISAREIPIYPHRDIFFILEERHTLGKLTSSLKTKALARKHGLCFVSGWQSPAQQRSIYGQDDANAMADLCNTSVIARVKGRNSAKILSEQLGEQEIEVVSEAISYGTTDNRSGINYSKHSQIRPVVLPSEIQRLNDLEAYLSLKGDLPISKIKIPINNKTEVQPGFVERKIKKDEEIERLFNANINKAKAEGVYYIDEEKFMGKSNDTDKEISVENIKLECELEV